MVRLTEQRTPRVRCVRTRSAHLGGVSPRRKGNHEDPLPSGKKGNHTDVLPPGIPQPGRKGGRLMETPPASPSGLTGGPDATKTRPTVRATTGTRFPPFPSASCVVVCVRGYFDTSTDGITNTTCSAHRTQTSQLRGSISRKERMTESGVRRHLYTFQLM